jgi:hypothetical protein
MKTSWSDSVTHGFERAILLTCILCSVTALSVSAAPADPPPGPPNSSESAPHEEWTGVYLGGQKVGYGRTIIAPITYGGKPALRETSHSIQKILLLGQSMQEEENSVSITDLKSQPITETIDVNSNGSSMHLVADYDYVARKIHVKLGEGADASTKDLEIPVGANLAGDVDFATAGRKLIVGDKFDIYALEPTRIVLEPIHIEITGRQEIADETGTKVPVFVVHETMSIGDSTEWIDSKGDAIKGEIQVGPLQIVMTAESKKHALDTGFISPTVSASGAPAYKPMADLAVVTSVSVNKTIDDPRKLTTLHATMSGIPDRRLILSDSRQQETVVGGEIPPLSVDLVVTSEMPSKSNTLKLPISDPAMSVYLKKEAYLNTEDESLRKTALHLRGSETDAFKVAIAIRDWVHQNMTPDASIGVPRSASDVFTRRRGVCRDYATLYAALARIAGVPTRLCAGVVYGDLDGHSAFFYHAWAECYVAPGKWVAIDPTLYDPSLGIDYVDATHIKFAQGDVTQMYDATSVVGKLKITIQ